MSACDGRPLTEDNPACTSSKYSNLNVQPNLQCFVQVLFGTPIVVSSCKDPYYGPLQPAPALDSFLAV